jgi:hypothetical protein
MLVVLLELTYALWVNQNYGRDPDQGFVLYGEHHFVVAFYTTLLFHAGYNKDGNSALYLS